MCTGWFLCMSVQNQLHNLTLLVDKVKRSPGCFINIIRPNTLMNAQEALHPGTHSAHIQTLASRGHQSPIVDLHQLNPVSWLFVFLSEFQHVRNCPIDCASIYYNGVRRSGLYTVVPSLAGMPVEVYCDMDTDGESHTCTQRKAVAQSAMVSSG